MTTTRSVTHDTFTTERSYNADPARVFSSWSDAAAKSQWFGNPDGWQGELYELDFREGGSERLRGRLEGGPEIAFEASYMDIVENERIVYAYAMQMDGARMSASLATVELRPEGSGTRLVLTEQGVFLDGLDDPEQRRKGTELLLDGLASFLAD